MTTGKEVRRFDAVLEDPDPDTHGPREAPGEVQCVAITPDGRHALSGRTGGVVQVWDLKTGNEVRRLSGHSGTVFDLAVSPDGRRALTGSRDRTARLWDLDTGRELQRFEGHGGWVRSVAFLADGRRGLTGAGPGDPLVRLWDLETGAELARLNLGGIVHDLVPCLDGRRALAAVNPEGTDAPGAVVLIEFQDDAKILRRFTGQQSQITDLAISPDGRRFLTSSYDTTMRVWDLNSGQELQRLKGNRGWVLAVAYGPLGDLAVSAGGGSGGPQTVDQGRDYALRLWDLSGVPKIGNGRDEPETVPGTSQAEIP